MKREPPTLFEDVSTKRHKSNFLPVSTNIQQTFPDEPIEEFAHNLASSGEYPYEALNTNVLETLRSISNHHNQRLKSNSDISHINSIQHSRFAEIDFYNPNNPEITSHSTHRSHISGHYRSNNYENSDSGSKDHSLANNFRQTNTNQGSAFHSSNNLHSFNRSKNESSHYHTADISSKAVYQGQKQASDVISSKKATSYTYRDSYTDEAKVKIEQEDKEIKEKSFLTGPSTFQERVKKQIETDPRRLEQRQKQIDLGKNTPGYAAYIKAVPRKDRIRGDERHPVTPNKHIGCSKRSFDGQIKKWRKLLHRWDPEGEIKLTADDFEQHNLNEIDNEMAELERLLKEKEENLEKNG